MLEQIPFFQGLNEAELKRLEDISILKKYKKGEFLFMEGEESKWLHLLIKGSLKLYKIGPKGKEIFMHQFNGISFVAELANFENIKFPATAIFLTGGEVLKIASELIHQELVLNSEAKVARFLVNHADLFNELKHIKIASILNITPETFSRILAKFKTQNLIELDANNKIVNIATNELSEIFEG